MSEYVTRAGLIPLSTVVSALAAASLACGLGGSSAPRPTPSGSPTPIIDFPATAAAEVSPTPSTALDGRACFITSGSGQLTCIDAQGLRLFTETDFELGDDFATDITACGDRFAIAYDEDVVLFDGVGFERIPVDLPEESYGVDTVTCDPAGRTMAVAASGGFVLLRGDDGWLTFDLKEQDRDDDPEYTDVVDVALPGDGSLWVTLGSNLARWDGSTWQVFAQGQDWGAAVYFSQLAVGPDGVVYAASDFGLMRYDGELTPIDNDEAAGALGLAVTSTHILAGHGFGAFLLDHEGRTVAAHPVGERPELPFAASIYSVALDGLGRSWLATTYGLLLIDETGAYHLFRMSNTAMADNALDSLAVIGTPPLPPLVEHATGSLTAAIVRDGAPLADAVVVACALDYSLDTPCAGDPEFVTTHTNADGVFTFEGLPRATYAVHVQIDADEWTALADADGYYLGQVLVDSGAVVDLGTVGTDE